MRFALLLFAASALAQTPPPNCPPFCAQFDSATVAPSAPQTGGQVHTQGTTDTAQGTLQYTNITVRDFMSQTLEVRHDQIRGPEWLDTDRYDFAAQFQPHTSIQNLAQMVQILLLDRFGMIIHREPVERPVYNLEVAAGGPKFGSSSSAGTNPGVTADVAGDHWQVSVQGTLRHFANFLSDELDRPVLDKTGLAGSYQFTAAWDKANISSALEQQLGLKLVPAEGPVETIVVDNGHPLPPDSLADEAAFAIQIGFIAREDWPGGLCVGDGFNRYADRIGLSRTQKQALRTQRGKAALEMLTPAQRAKLDSLPAEVKRARERHEIPQVEPLCH